MQNNRNEMWDEVFKAEKAGNMLGRIPKWWWWYYPTPSEGWGQGGTLRRPNSRATPQGLDHRSRIEREEPKIDLRRGSEAGQSRRR